MVVQFPNKTLRESSPNRQPLYLLMILVRNVTTESFFFDTGRERLFVQTIHQRINEQEVLR